MRCAETKIVAAADGVLREVDASVMLYRMEQVQTELMALRSMHRFFRQRGTVARQSNREARREIVPLGICGSLRPARISAVRHPPAIPRLGETHARLC